ncbi:hypothetical protein [Pseudomonas sp. 2FE]|uniref:hypothetical protein n=1 Tax=Pseudomonas sp. 2FE TaxID=2502190 RepID=UPI0021140A6A|nr:hypothetical protein [Pseudomonas sp. 2FE]
MPMLRLLFASVFAIVLTGCASSAKIEGMTVSDNQAQALQFDKPLHDNLQLSEVAGGEKTNPLWTSEIDGTAFQAALHQSLNNAGLLSASSQAPFALRAKLQRVDQPLFGLDFEVTTEVEYTLVDNVSGKVLFREVVRAPFTAGVGDAFYGVKRLRLANEGSAKENIAALLKRLSVLKVEARQVSLSQ